MFGKLLTIISGKDDVERIAFKEKPELLDEYLKTRRLSIPIEPKRFLDAAKFTQEQLMELIEDESEDLAGNHLNPWVLEVDGMRRLPAFSSQKKMELFSAKMSEQLNEVFALKCVDVLLADITRDLSIDFVDLNLFSDKSWEIGLGRLT